jgi:hypothetical protein
MTNLLKSPASGRRRRHTVLIALGFILTGGSAIASSGFVPGGFSVPGINGGTLELPSSGSASSGMPGLGGLGSTDGGLSVPGIGGGMINIPSSGGISAPDDWLNGGGLSGADLLSTVFGDLFSIMEKENEVFGVMQEVVLGQSDIMRGEGGEAKNPFELRMPEKESANPREVAQSRTPGLLTDSAIVRERDFANLYDQLTARTASAPYLGDNGKQWLEGEVKSSGDIMTAASQNTTQAGEVAKTATAKTSTQDVVKEIANGNALIANQVMMNNAMDAENNEALLAIQRINALDLALSANTGEALDEGNRRERFERGRELRSDAISSIVVPGLNDTPSSESSTTRTVGTGSNNGITPPLTVGARSPIEGE